MISLQQNPTGPEVDWKPLYTQILIATFVLIILGTGGWAIYDYQFEKTEGLLQTRLSKVEREIEKEKAKSKSGQLEIPASDPRLQAWAKELQGIMKEKPGSQSAKLASIMLLDLSLDTQGQKLALESAVQVKLGTDFLSGLVLLSVGRVQADLGDCALAIETWNKVGDTKTLVSLKKESELRKALCYERTNQVDLAKEIYSRLAGDKEARAHSQAAQKYSRGL